MYNVLLFIIFNYEKVVVLYLLLPIIYNMYQLGTIVPKCYTLYYYTI